MKSRLKKITVLFIGLGVLLSTFPFSYLAFSNKLGVFFSSVSSNALGRLDVKKFNGDKRELILKYIKSVTNGLDPHDAWVQWKFVSNGGACNHLSDMFIFLMEYPLDIKGKTYGLVWKDGVSRHTLPMLESSDKKGSVIYDPYYGKSAKNDKGIALKTQEICQLGFEDFEKLPKITKDYFWNVYRQIDKEMWGREKGFSLFCEGFTIRGENHPFSERPFWSQIAIKTFDKIPLSIKISFFKFTTFVEWIKKKAMIGMDIKTYPFPADGFHGGLSFHEFFSYNSARINHIFLNLDDAEIHYKEILKASKKETLKGFSREFLKKIEELKPFMKTSV